MLFAARDVVELFRADFAGCFAALARVGRFAVFAAFAGRFAPPAFVGRLAAFAGPFEPDFRAFVAPPADLRDDFAAPVDLPADFRAVFAPFAAVFFAVVRRVVLFAAVLPVAFFFAALPADERPAVFFAVDLVAFAGFAPRALLPVPFAADFRAEPVDLPVALLRADFAPPLFFAAD